MGNCQAIDTATLVIEQPNGKVERLYCPVSASEVMKTNPGHYVALLISSTTLCTSKNTENCPNKKHNNNHPVRITRIKLLKPTDTLLLGQVYRLISDQGQLLSIFTLFSFLFLFSFPLKKFYPFSLNLNLCVILVSEVMKGLWAKKQAKMKKNLSESESSQMSNQKAAGGRSEPDDNKVNLNPIFDFFFTVSSSKWFGLSYCSIFKNGNKFISLI